MKSSCSLFKSIKSSFNVFTNNGVSKRVCSSYASVPPEGYVKELDEGYKPHVVEKEKYETWEKSGRFVYTPQIRFPFKQKTFSMILPPPNITGNLHLGHALTTTLQDVIARWKRMSGYNVMFLPGMDHAGIATQVVVEKYLARQGIDKHTLGKEKFVEEVKKWKDTHGSNIQQQLRRLGASLDWSREVFTMDEEHATNVKKAFVELSNHQLIHRSEMLVNWSCTLRSAISDMEVDSLTLEGPTFINVPGYEKPVHFGLIYNIAYKLYDCNDYEQQEIVVATTRPETVLGDVAIAVHPGDERYSKYINRLVRHPLISDRVLPIIGDPSVNKNFGTGAVKLTPAHDKNDYETCKRHNLAPLCVMDGKGSMCGNFKYHGMPRFVARSEVLKDLQEYGLFRGQSPHALTLPVCNRSGDIVEFLPMPQWYLKCDEMAKEVEKQTKAGSLKIIPENHSIVWHNWLAGQKDWCLTRQIWWGIDLPIHLVYHKVHTEKAKFYSGVLPQEAVSQYVSDHGYVDLTDLASEQEDDVLDTWFSSGVYPFTAFGWPCKTKDYKQLYPLSLMVTGYDIMCLWVVRMAMLGLKLTNKLPFPKVLFHGIVTDAHGAKMSKSKGNVINPIDVIEGATLEELNLNSKTLYDLGTLNKKEFKLALDENKKQFPNGIPECGADALRFTLCEVNPKNQMITFNVSRCYTNKLFCNKIWQSMRFYKNCYNVAFQSKVHKKCTKEHLQKIDLWLLSRLSDTVGIVNKSLNDYDFHVATEALKSFLYYNLCDVYIECTKKALKSNMSDESNILKLTAHCHVFSACFNAALRLLSPFMPFVTEDLIQAIPMTENIIIPRFDDSISDLHFPQSQDFAMFRDLLLEKQAETCMNIVSVVRQLRHTFNIEYKLHPKIHIDAEEMSVYESVDVFKDVILFLTKCESIEMKHSEYESVADVWSYYHQDNCKVFLELPHTEEMIQKIKDAKEKLVTKREKLLKNLKKLQKIVNDSKYVTSASPDVKRDHFLRIKEIKDNLEKIDYIKNYNN